MFDKSHPTTIPEISDLDLCRLIHVFGIHGLATFNHVTFMTLCTLTEFNGGIPLHVNTVQQRHQIEPS